MIDVSLLRVKGLMTWHIDTLDGQRHLVGLHVYEDFDNLRAYVLKRLDDDIASLTKARVAFVPHSARGHPGIGLPNHAAPLVRHFARCRQDPAMDVSTSPFERFETRCPLLARNKRGHVQDLGALVACASFDPASLFLNADTATRAVATQEIQMTQNDRMKPREDAGQASAESGVVVLDGPDGVAVTMTADAAVLTAESLHSAAELARSQTSDNAAGTFDSPQWRNDLLRKIGCYGVSDLQLLEIAGVICSRQTLTDEQRRYACNFEAQLGEALTYSPFRTGLPR